MIAAQNLRANKKTVFCGKTYDTLQFKKLKPAPKTESNWSINKLRLVKSQKFIIKKKSIKCNFKSHICQKK
jgi:hypothetical protein